MTRSTAQYQNAEDFTSLEKLSEAKGGLFTHEVHKVTNKNDTNNIYYQKSCTDNKLVTAIEATAGQLFNLLMPYQPQTLLAKNAAGKEFILSQELPGYKSFEDQYKKIDDIYALKDSIHSGKLEGLGSVLTASYFLNETDSKLGNLGIATINGKEKAIKIDGDWCFSAIRAPGTFGYNEKNQRSAHITEKGVSQLPLMDDYQAYNWLDYVKKGATQGAYSSDIRFRLINESLPDEPHFRKEVNEMMLKILLIPPELAKEIVSRNTNEEKFYESITNEIANRQEQMSKASLENGSFNVYMQSADAKNCLAETISDIEKFQKNNKLSSNDFSGVLEENFQSIVIKNSIPAIKYNISEIQFNISSLESEFLACSKPRERYKILESIHDKLMKAIELSDKVGDIDGKENFTKGALTITDMMSEVNMQNVIEVKEKLLSEAMSKFYSESMDLGPAIELAKQIAEKAQELHGLTKSDRYGALAEEWKEETKGLMKNMPESKPSEEDQNDNTPKMGRS